jgi:hypothetical protein
VELKQDSEEADGKVAVEVTAAEVVTMTIALHLEGVLVGALEVVHAAETDIEADLPRIVVEGKI